MGLPPTPPTGAGKKELPPAYEQPPNGAMQGQKVSPPPHPKAGGSTLNPPPQSAPASNGFQSVPSNMYGGTIQPPPQPQYVPSPTNSVRGNTQTPIDHLNYAPSSAFSTNTVQPPPAMQQRVMTGRIVNDQSKGRGGSSSNKTSSFEQTLSATQREAIQSCAAMGFSRDKAIQVLTSTNWNVEHAVAMLLGDDSFSGGSSGGNRSSSTPAPPGKRKLRFKVPANVKSGQTVTIQDGVSKKKFNVKIPATAKPGSTLQIFVDE